MYCSFDSKEEIVVLTVVDNLTEFEARGVGLPDTAAPVTALHQTCERDAERLSVAWVRDMLALARITDGAST
jgi:hypothetical protein